MFIYGGDVEPRGQANLGAVGKLASMLKLALLLCANGSVSWLQVTH